MSAIEVGVYKALLADPVVVGQVSDRVFAGYVPQTASLPAIAYQTISGQQAGAVGGGLGTSNATIQVAITAGDYTTAKTIAEAIRAWFPFRGFLGGRCEVFQGVIRGEFDGYDQQIESPTVRLDLWFLYSDP